LSGTQFSTLKCAGINDPEGPEKYNNTEVKYGAALDTFKEVYIAVNEEQSYHLLEVISLI
jgi:hypothetical protein